jgi:nucleotide-binding universal stress UspA family protein
MVRFKKLLVPVDFSEPSRQAFHAGVAMAADTGVPLVLVHVVQGPVAESRSETVESARLALARWQHDAEVAGAELVSTRVIMGTPWHEIVELLRADRTFDLVIVGTHGRTGIQQVLLGSVAERVVRHAPCPVLVVRVPDY